MLSINQAGETVPWQAYGIIAVLLLCAVCFIFMIWKMRKW